MSKIDEIIRSVDANVSDNPIHLDNLVLDDVKYCMRSYAEWYAKKCLAIAADEAMLNYETESGAMRDEPVVEKSSIIDIIMPDHE